MWTIMISAQVSSNEGLINEQNVSLWSKSPYSPPIFLMYALTLVLFVWIYGFSCTNICQPKFELRTIFNLWNCQSVYHFPPFGQLSQKMFFFQPLLSYIRLRKYKENKGAVWMEMTILWSLISRIRMNWGAFLTEPSISVSFPHVLYNYVLEAQVHMF